MTTQPADAPPTSLKRRADALAQTHFTGGRPDRFEASGRDQLITMLEHGLTPATTVCDVGCGALRGGYWLLHLLQPGCYHGIEPNTDMLQAGLDHILEPGLAEAKRPHFDNNDRFDLTVFSRCFDMVVAKAVWTHAAKPQIEALLASFAHVARDHSVLLADYWPAKANRPDYTGQDWVGRSHISDEPGWIGHDRAWIKAACHRRNLHLADAGTDRTDRHRWLKITPTPQEG